MPSPNTAALIGAAAMAVPLMLISLAAALLALAAPAVPARCARQADRALNRLIALAEVLTSSHGGHRHG